MMRNLSEKGFGLGNTVDDPSGRHCLPFYDGTNPISTPHEPLEVRESVYADQYPLIPGISAPTKIGVASVAK